MTDNEKPSVLNITPPTISSDLYKKALADAELNKAAAFNIAGDNTALNMTIVRLINLLGDICKQAQEEPLKLVAFNSPLLSLAALEYHGHFNPPAEGSKDEEDRDKAIMIYKVQALTSYNG